MRLALFSAALHVPLGAAFGFNAYDLGFHGLYPRQHFHSVDLEPLKPVFTQWDSRCGDSGNLLFTVRGPSVQGLARGPVMLDAKGELIWMDNHKFHQAMNLNVQKYKGEDYLTFWTKHKKTKKNGAKHSKKSFVMLNLSYEVAHRITPHGKGMKGDSHEFRITPQGTALVAIYYKHQVDCTDLKLGKSCWIQDGWFQEIDIETGRLIFEWRATDHIRMTDVFSSPSRKDGYGTSKKDAFDFFHINSVDKMDTGDYLISARYMHAVVCISGKTGEILWQLGGKNNDFKDLNNALDFAWQHHVTWQGNNTISLFDNHANSVLHAPSMHSKGMIIQLDFENMTAALVQKFVHPDEILNVSQGSVQILPGPDGNGNGNVLVGFGNSPTFVEYTADGQVLCAAHFAPHVTFELVDFGLAKSYRVFKSRWVGRPKTVPDVKVEAGKAWVSWNGATEVKRWRLESSKTAEAGDGDFVTVQELEKDGFETGFELRDAHKYVRVVALDANRVAMASSAVVKTTSPKSFWKIFFLMIIFAILVPSLIISIVNFGALHVLSRRLPRLPHFPRLNLSSKWRFPSFRSRNGYKAVRGDDEEYAAASSESDPLLLNDRGL